MSEHYREESVSIKLKSFFFVQEVSDGTQVCEAKRNVLFCVCYKATFYFRFRISKTVGT